jgi:hypothetical protein
VEIAGDRNSKKRRGGVSCGAVRSQAREMVRQGYTATLVHTLVFGINNLCSGEMPYVCAKPRCLGPSKQLLCNRSFALNTRN